MTDRDRPIVPRESAPDHGPMFWEELDAEFGVTAASTVGSVDSSTAEFVMEPTAVLPTVSRHEEQAAVTQLATDRGLHRSAPAGQTSRRAAWPFAAAAAVLAVLALGFVALRGNDAPGTEIVAGNEDASETETVVPLEGPTNGDGGADSGQEDQSSPDGGAGSDAAGASDDELPEEEALEDSSPDIVPALGALGVALHEPFDEQIRRGSSYLANWPASDLTWYGSLLSPEGCERWSLVYVNGSGLTQQAREGASFSGELSHFSLNSPRRHAAWLTTCGDQMEFYVASLETTGELNEQRLVWFGSAMADPANVAWDGPEVTLTSIRSSGSPLTISYDIERGLARQDGKLLQMLSEESAPTVEVRPVAVAAGTMLSYWAQVTANPTGLACADRVSSDQAFWLRREQGEDGSGQSAWEGAVPSDLLIGQVTAAAIHPDLAGIAFADACADTAGRVFAGTAQDDGRIGELIEIDLAPFVPGFASELYWTDMQTLRIHTDNSEFGVEAIRFEYRLGGESGGQIFQLD